METEGSKGVPRYVYVLCLFAGGFAAFLIPEGNGQQRQSGLLGAFIAFELSHIVIIDLVGLVFLMYLLKAKKFPAKQEMAVYAGVGFVTIQLLLASRSLLQS